MKIELRSVLLFARLIRLDEAKKALQWLAKELEIDESIVGNWCKNFSQPSFIHLFKTAKILNKQPKNLYL